MTLRALGLTMSFACQRRSVPIGILALVAMMMLPLPVFLLDTFFVSNILVSLLILMVAMHAAPLVSPAFQPAADRDSAAPWTECCLNAGCPVRRS